MSQYIIALDEGTSSCRAVLFDAKAQIVDVTQQEFTQIFPNSGWVEHDPEEIWTKQLEVLTELIQKNSVKSTDIAAIGITNQRETTLIWDKKTGEPIYNAIVWQDRRTADICENLIKDGWEDIIKAKTGLVVDAYFSGTKIQWILDQVPQARAKAEAGELLFGTMDSWLIWKLTKGKQHVTDCTNACRTMLMNIESQEWDEELLEALNVPIQILPEIKDSDAHFGNWEFDGATIPIQSVLGDQHAALFGHGAWHQGDAKNTYGTGCFMLMNTATNYVPSDLGLLSTVAWRRSGKVCYALEGSVFIAGAAIQWLRDGLKIIDSAKDTENMANEAIDDEHLVVVPAFAGLGAPYWDMNARGAIFGLTRGSGQAEIVRATLQSLALQTYDVLEAMQTDSGIKLSALKVDGGAIANNYLAQFQSDILDVEIHRPQNLEATASGAAYMAGLAIDFWNENFILEQSKLERRFTPEMSSAEKEKHITLWKKAIERTRGWLS